MNFEKVKKLNLNQNPIKKMFISEFWYESIDIWYLDIVADQNSKNKLGKTQRKRILY